MEYKKYLIIFSILLLVILAFGCQKSDTTQQSNVTNPLPANYKVPPEFPQDNNGNKEITKPQIPNLVNVDHMGTPRIGYTISYGKGWQLFPYDFSSCFVFPFVKGKSIVDNTQETTDFFSYALVQFYLPQFKKYAIIDKALGGIYGMDTPEEQALVKRDAAHTSGDDNFIGQWYYLDKPMVINWMVPSKPLTQWPISTTEERNAKMFKGWNHFIMPLAFAEKSAYSSIQIPERSLYWGNCTIEKADIWDTNTNEWLEIQPKEGMSLQQTIESDAISYVGRGLAFNVKDDCSLSLTK